jgi:hypothetical protein
MSVCSDHNVSKGTDLAPGTERTFMIRRVVVLVAFALLVPCLAMANTVSFSTTGTFSNPSLFPITFTGNSLTNFVGGNIAFGMFNVSACAVAKCSGTETFTLAITETSPVSATVDLTGTITGSVLKDGHTSLTITFSPSTIMIGGTMYTIPFMHSINFSFTTLNGAVSFPTVPEPSAGFLLGMGALGLMGLAAVSRNKMVSV